MSPQPASPLRSLPAIAAAALLLALLSPLSPAPALPAASAAEPPVAVGEFMAPPCPGDTLDEPTAAWGVIPNLLRVFGQRLTDYNDGRVVVLHDAYGGNYSSYPALCATRYVESVGGPVSEWMFCTDRHSSVCGETDSAGRLFQTMTDRGADPDDDADDTFFPLPANPMDSLVENPRLDANQTALISYLVHKGHPYVGVGNQRWNDVREARSDRGTDERTALQTLVWCISDPVPPSELPRNQDLKDTCDNNMSPAIQAELLAMIPRTPEFTLSFDGTTQRLAAGETARFELTTNVYQQPIALSSTPAGALTVCAGDATMDAAGLTVRGADSAISTTVALCFTAAEAGTVEIAATAQPPSTEHIGWAQSQNNADGLECQVFATFNEDAQLTLRTTTSATFAASLPATGAEGAAPLGAMAAGTLLALLGAALLLTRSRGIRASK